MKVCMKKYKNFPMYSYVIKVALAYSYFLNELPETGALAQQKLCTEDEKYPNLDCLNL